MGCILDHTIPLNHTVQYNPPQSVIISATAPYYAMRWYNLNNILGYTNICIPQLKQYYYYTWLLSAHLLCIAALTLAMVFMLASQVWAHKCPCKSPHNMQASPHKSPCKHLHKHPYAPTPNHIHAGTHPQACRTAPMQGYTDIRTHWDHNSTPAPGLHHTTPHHTTTVHWHLTLYHARPHYTIRSCNIVNHAIHNY